MDDGDGNGSMWGTETGTAAISFRYPDRSKSITVEAVVVAQSGGNERTKDIVADTVKLVPRV